MADNYYQLEKSSAKLYCPKCNKKSFVPYVFRDTGEPVDKDKFGRCDRENNCAYHLHPKDDNFKPDRTIKPVLKVEEVQIFPEESKINLITKRTKTCTSNLHKYCKSKLLIPNDHLLKWGIYTDNELSVFLFRNVAGVVCNLKCFKYKNNGHRDKEFQAYSLKQPPSTPIEKPEGGFFINKYRLPLFGEHLLDEKKKRIVVVVESEKTAAIASFMYKQFDWLSCSSCNGLTLEKLKVLKGRRVIWLADADKAGRNNSSIRNLKQQKIEHQVLDLFSDRDNGDDLCDEIEKGVRPEISWNLQKEIGNEYEVDDDFNYTLPDGVEWEKVKNTILKYGFFVYKRQIWVIKYTNGDSKNTSASITNFSVKPLGHIQSKLNPRRIIEIENKYKYKRVLEVPTKAFISNTDFGVFVESEGNYQYDGTIRDLKRLRSWVYDQMKSYEEIETLGWNNGYFIFSNGVFNGNFTPVNEYGFVALDNRNFFIPALSILNRYDAQSYEEEKKFEYVERDIPIQTWANKFIEVHKNNGKIALAWYISSLFRDFIYSKFKFFPHLFLFGPPGTGKSQVGWSVRALGFTGIKKPFNLTGGTKVAFHREMSHFVNFPTWFDEYDNSIDYDRVQALKAAYDGTGHKKSVKDSENLTKSIPVNSAVMISGQQLPIADNALFKRVVLLQFHQTEYSETEKKLFRELQEMEEGGLTFITAGMMKYRKLIEKDFMDEFDEVLKDFIIEFKKMKYDVEDRIMRNMCIPLTVLKIIQAKSQKEIPVTYLDLKPIAIDFIRTQMELISNANETHAFWDMVSFLIDNRLINDGEDFELQHKSSIKIYHQGNVQDRNLGGTKKVLFMRLSKIVPLYRENFKKQNSSTVSSMDKSSLEHYLKHSKPYLGNLKNHRFSKAGVSSCMAFDYELLQTEGVELERDITDSPENAIKVEIPKEGYIQTDFTKNKGAPF